MYKALVVGALASALLSGCIEKKSSVTERYHQILEAFPTSASQSIDCNFFWGTQFITESLVCDVRDSSLTHEPVLLLVFTLENRTGPETIFAVRSLDAVDLYDSFNTVMPFLPEDIDDVYGMYHAPTSAHNDRLFDFGSTEPETTFEPAPGLADFINAMLKEATTH